MITQTENQPAPFRPLRSNARFGVLNTPIPEQPSVFIIDADISVHESLRGPLEMQAISVFVYESAEAFLEYAPRKSVGCLITELNLPGLDGLQCFMRLKELDWGLPTIILTAEGDVARCAEAFRAGITDFIEKPIDPVALVERVREALEHRRLEHERDERKRTIEQRFATLTEREREVAEALIAGQSMKEIAGNAGTSFQSVARHRQRIFAKMHVQNDVALANLVNEGSGPQSI